MTQDEIQRIVEALMLIYGSDLQAATVTVLLKDGDTAVRFITTTLPQQSICLEAESTLKESDI